jgi:hypothetical protein
MNCLACGHDNRAGEESCVSCSASLNLKLCERCDAINAADAERCHNCGAERSLPSAWVISGEPGPVRRRLRAGLLAVPVLALASFAAYHFSSPVPEARAVPVTPPSTPAVEVKAIEAPKAPMPRTIPRVTHTRGFESASSGGATSIVQ